MNERPTPLNLIRPPKLSRARMRAAIIVAVTADVLQLCLGPFGWVGADQTIDIVAMVLTIWLIGFHPLLLPTVVLELFPIADWLPTWTGCVLLILARRKQTESSETEPTPAIVNPPPMLPPANK